LTRVFRATLRRSVGSLAALLLFFESAPVNASTVRTAGVQPDWNGHFELRSKTFTNGSTLPQSMILNAAAIDGGTPVVGCEGANESPQLSWTNAPRGTRSFAIVMFDTDASFFHWGIYNIPGDRTSLPQNAGIAKSALGQQVFDDFPLQSYNGPCPPTSFAHHYVFTIYALDGMVTLNVPPQLFPKVDPTLPTGETLFDTLLAGRAHILASASIFGLYGLPAGASQAAGIRLKVH
jgi:hypothetical protein